MLEPLPPLDLAARLSGQWFATRKRGGDLSERQASLPLRMLQTGLIDLLGINYRGVGAEDCGVGVPAHCA